MKSVKTSCSGPETATLWRCGGRQCPQGTCDHGDVLQRPTAGPGPGVAPPIVHDVLRSAGAPLPGAVRYVMEERLGHDFADVRIHTDARANDSALAVGARAYAVGRHVVFAAGMFDPRSPAGMQLLTHELVHTSGHQLWAGRPTGEIRISSPADAGEREAARASTTAQPGMAVPTRPDTMKTATRYTHQTSTPTLWRCGGRICAPGECDHDEVQRSSHSFDQVSVVGAGLAPRRTCALEGVDESVDHEESEPNRNNPRQPLQAGGAATIVCNGRGGYRVAMNSWAGASCGIASCVRRHEESHAADWRRRWPDGCKDKADGAQIPLGGDGYNAFLRRSECTAYGVEESCITPLHNVARRDGTACEITLRDHLADTRSQKASFC